MEDSSSSGSLRRFFFTPRLLCDRSDWITPDASPCSEAIETCQKKKARRREVLHRLGLRSDKDRREQLTGDSVYVGNVTGSAVHTLLFTLSGIPFHDVMVKGQSTPIHPSPEWTRLLKTSSAESLHPSLLQISIWTRDDATGLGLP